MLKVRITFTDTEKGQEELAQLTKLLDKNCEILNNSRVYKGRNGSKFSNKYIDLEIKD